MEKYHLQFWGYLETFYLKIEIRNKIFNGNKMYSETIIETNNYSPKISKTGAPSSYLSSKTFNLLFFSLHNT